MARVSSNIRRVMVDRMRVVKRRREMEDGSPAPSLHGMTQVMEHPPTPYIPCRIDPANSRENRSNGNRQRVVTHTMICDMEDETGAPVDLHPSDFVLIEKGPPSLGVWQDYGRFEVVSEVQRPRDRTKERLIVTQLARLERH